MTETREGVREYQNYIDGEWVTSTNGETHELVNAGKTDEIVGRVPLSTAEDARKAVEAAHAAFQEWQYVPPPERMQYVYGLLEVWKQRRDELAEAMTLEMGKTINEARTEVDRGVGEMRFVAGEAQRIDGKTLPSGRQRVFAYTVREPTGVIAAITPWNFPVLSPLRKVIPALMYGCTVVLKPALQSPLTAVMIFEMLQEVGLPAGTANLVIGRGGAVGDTLVTHPLVRGVTFSGSTEVGLGIYEKTVKNNPKMQLEMGGKNAAVVAGCADLKNAASQIVPAAYAATGQRCTSISRVIVLKEHQKELEEALVEEVQKLKVGYGFDESATMGPLVNRSQFERSVHYIEQAHQDDARVLIGGNKITGNGLDNGYYIEPTVLTDVKAGTPAALDEIFGPVLVVIPVESFEEALAVNNEVRYGLTSSIFTDNMEWAQAFTKSSETGMVHVNNGTVSEGHMPFGGIKQSGRGAYSIGATNKDFYTNLKVVYHQYTYEEGNFPPAQQVLPEEDPA